VDDFHGRILELADELGLDDDEREEYVDFHMGRAGYQRATTWTTPEPAQGGGRGGQRQQQGGFMSGSKQRQATKQAGRGGGQAQGGSYFKRGSRTGQ
jgi:hypothetical protein